MKPVKSFTGANFTGFLGDTFRFQTLGNNGNLIGIELTGRVWRIFQQEQQTCVEFLILDKKCTHIYEAERIYFKGEVTGGAAHDL